MIVSPQALAVITPFSTLATASLATVYLTFDNASSAGVTRVLVSNVSPIFRVISLVLNTNDSIFESVHAASHTAHDTTINSKATFFICKSHFVNYTTTTKICQLKVLIST